MSTYNVFFVDIRKIPVLFDLTAILNFVLKLKFPLPLGVWEGLRFVIVALPGLFFYFFL